MGIDRGHERDHGEIESSTSSTCNSKCCACCSEKTVEARVTVAKRFTKRKESQALISGIDSTTERLSILQGADRTYNQTPLKRQRLGPVPEACISSITNPIEIIDDSDNDEAVFETEINKNKHALAIRELDGIPEPINNNNTNRLSEDDEAEQIHDGGDKDNIYGNVVYVSDDEEIGNEDSEDLDDGNSLPGVEEPREIIDLTEDVSQPSPVLNTSQLITTPIKFSTASGTPVTCAPRKTVEFTNSSFMRIKSMLRDSSGEIHLIGQCFVRQNFFGPRVPKRRNEVVWTVEQVSGGDGLKKKLLVPADIIRNRKLIMTNIVFPRRVEDIHHPRNHPDSFADIHTDVAHGPLFCRMKRCRVLRNGGVIEEAWASLKEDEADAKDKIPHTTNQTSWRGDTKPGGSHTEFRSVYNLDSSDQSEHYVEAQQYSFGDAFCGAGGTSCGARLAGLHIVWSFDYELKAVQTYRLNFRGTECRHEAVDEFIAYATTRDFRVDILHISPPCQPFSPAHTIPSPERDEANEAALLSVGALLEVVKPRIVTIEQTFGLKSHHEAWLFALIHDFIRIGYSMRWKIMDCSQYGVPQTRRRLVIIGAGPGEILPDFPLPTHGTGPGLKPVDTVRRVLAKVPRNAPNHDVTRQYQTPKPPVSPDQIAKTITTNGGVKNQHPSGLRPFTIREVACFQTMPLSFQFADVGITAQKKQVGNAVPPMLAATLYKSIIASLKKTDGVD